MEQGKLYIFFGLIASGKSTLAEAFAAEHGFPSYNTDRVRKELAGIAATERQAEGMGQGIYSQAFTEKTYQAMLSRAADVLQQGGKAGVVLDGSYGSEKDRSTAIQLASTLGIGIHFILCSCSGDETRRRLELRAQDPMAVSDGRWEIYIQQKKKFEHPDELTSDQLVLLDTEAEPSKLLRVLGKQILIRP